MVQFPCAEGWNTGGLTAFCFTKWSDEACNSVILKFPFLYCSEPKLKRENHASRWVLVIEIASRIKVFHLIELMEVNNPIALYQQAQDLKSLLCTQDQCWREMQNTTWNSWLETGCHRYHWQQKDTDSLSLQVNPQRLLSSRGCGRQKEKSSLPFSFRPAISQLYPTEGSSFSPAGRVSFVDLRSHWDLKFQT